MCSEGDWEWEFWVRFIASRRRALSSTAMRSPRVEIESVRRKVKSSRISRIKINLTHCQLSVLWQIWIICISLALTTTSQAPSSTCYEGDCTLSFFFVRFTYLDLICQDCLFVVWKTPLNNSPVLLTALAEAICYRFNRARDEREKMHHGAFEEN